MPRYFFHLHSDVDSADHEGFELPDLEDAKTVALSSARFVARQTVMGMGPLIMGHHIGIENDEGQVLATVYFRYATKARPPGWLGLTPLGRQLRH